jgi:D-alanine-D-alanine ligase
MMRRIAVLCGGKSAEREVSLKTGADVTAALERRGHDAVEVDVAVDLIPQLQRLDPQAVFVALHGRWGEDGTVQGLLEMLGMPYTGSGVLASALAMDKALSKVVFRAAGVPTPDFQRLGPPVDAESVVLAPPLVIKPNCEGSTVGVSVVRDRGELAGALSTAFGHGPDALAEAFVEGREVTVGVLDDVPLPVVEIVPDSGFYDYESKYTPGRTSYLCPAPLEPELMRRVTEVGLAANRALGCSGASRVDLIIDGTGTPWVLEVNTIPGMTPTSLLPKAAAAAGLEFDELVERIVDGARLHA